MLRTDIFRILRDHERFTLTGQFRIRESHICVAGNGIAGPGAQKVAEALQVNTSLEELQLAWNCIVEHGAKALADALCVNTTLTALDMSANGIGMYRRASHISCAHSTAYCMFYSADCFAVVDSFFRSLMLLPKLQ
jgi:hypothetical protein